MRYATRLAWVGVGLVLALVLVAGILAASFMGYLGGGGTVRPKSNFSVSEAARFGDFPVFYAGQEVNGHSLTAVLRSPLGPMRKNQESVGFIYGTCEVGPGFDPGGCAPPVEISNEPACSRNLSMYGSGFGSPNPQSTRIRGTTAGFFEGGSRIEIQTGTTTVVIFAYSKREARSVARSLRGVNVAVTRGEPLPPPAPGAVEGKAHCPRPG